MLYTLIVIVCTSGAGAECLGANIQTMDCVSAYREVLARKPADSSVVSLECKRNKPTTETRFMEI